MTAQRCRDPRWRDARRHLRELPFPGLDPRDVQAILSRTVDATPRARRLGWRTLAAAACLAVVGAGAWIWTSPARAPDVTEAELVRIERDLEHALVRLGRVLNETERITAVDVLGMNARRAPSEATP